MLNNTVPPSPPPSSPSSLRATAGISTDIKIVMNFHELYQACGSAQLPPAINTSRTWGPGLRRQDWGVQAEASHLRPGHGKITHQRAQS